MKRFFFEKSTRSYTFEGVQLLSTKTFSLFRKSCDDIDNIVIFNRSTSRNSSIISGDIITVINRLISEYTETKSFGTDFDRFKDFQLLLVKLLKMYGDTVKPNFKDHFSNLVVSDDFTLDQPYLIYHKEGLQLHLFNGQYVDSFVETIPDSSRFSTDRDYICGNMVANGDVLTAIKYLTANKELAVAKFVYSKELANELKKFFGVQSFYYAQYLEPGKLPTTSLNKTKPVSSSSKKHKTSIINQGKAVTVTGIKLAEVKSVLQTWQIFYLEDEPQEFLIVANNAHIKSDRGNYLKILEELKVPEKVIFELLSQCGLPSNYFINFSYQEILNLDDLNASNSKRFNLNGKECWVNATPLVSKSLTKKDGLTYIYDLVILDQGKFSIIESYDDNFLKIMNVGGQNDLIHCVAEVDSIPFTLEDVYEFISKDYFIQI